MFDVILSLLISFVTTFFAIPVIIRVAEKKRLFDVPDERKIHQAPIPSLGGLGIFAGFILATLLTINFNEAGKIQYFLAAAVVIFFLGLKDDIIVLSPIKKFIGQLMATFLIVYAGGIQISSMQGFFGIHALPEVISLLLTYFTVLVIINSFNLIDGVDGLAAGLGIMTSLILGSYFFMAGNLPFAILGFSLAGCTASFLIYNFQPAKIFMGDTGSMLIGLVNAVLVIEFISTARTPESQLPLQSAPALGFAMVMIPLLDTLRMFAIRTFQRRSPFSADRNHIHHLLLDKGLCHRTITVLLVGFNLLVVGAVYYLRELGNTILIAGTVAVFFTGIAVLFYTRKPRRLVVPPAMGIDHHELDNTTPTIVKLAKKTILEQKN